jgi:cytoskeletal protein RodZ
MSNRMSVLSRRLGRFAGGFSFATVAFFSIGLYAAANMKGQVEFLFAGLVLVCLFASFFLWLAHGFAWAMIPEKPAEARKSAEALKPTEAMTPAEALKPAEAMTPAEALKPAEAVRPAEAMRPAEALKAAEPMRTAEPLKPAEPVKRAEEKKPVEAMKPAEDKKLAEEKVVVSEDPPDAKYTITGKRVY